MQNHLSNSVNFKDTKTVADREGKENEHDVSPQMDIQRRLNTSQNETRGHKNKAASYQRRENMDGGSMNIRA